MFDRFEDDCKKALNLARQEAQRHGHPGLAPEHVLAGLLKVPSCTAVELLHEAGADIGEIEARLRERFARGTGEPDLTTMLPFTPGTVELLKLSMQSAGDLGDSYVGTEHLLLGAAMLAERGGWKDGSDLLGVTQTRLAGALSGVRRGAGRGGQATASVPLQPSVLREETAALLSDPRSLLRQAAALCDRAKEAFVREQDFERTSRTRDLAYWLRNLADEDPSKRAEGS